MFTGFAFANSNISFDVSSISLGITLSKTTNAIDGLNYSKKINLDTVIMALQEAKTYPWAKGMKNAGVGLTIGGIAGIATGTTLLIIGTASLNAPLLIVGQIVLGVGATCLVAGIPLWIIGAIFNKKHEEALESGGEPNNNTNEPELSIREDGAIGFSW